MQGKIKYQKEMRKVYVIATECKKEMTESYFGRMAMSGRLKSLASCELHLVDGQREMWYDISSMQTLEQAFAVKEISFRELKHLILQITQVIEELEQYLLDGRQLCFQPEFLYVDMEQGQAHFLFDFTEKNEESSLRELGEFILERVGHEDEKAVDLAYFFYECVRKDNFSVKDIEAYLEREGLHNKPEVEEQEKNRESVENGENRENSENRVNSENGVTEPWEKEHTATINTKRREDKKSERDGKRQKKPQKRSTILIEAGLACCIMTILLLLLFFGIQKFFVLGRVEKLLWIGLSSLSFMAGLSAFGYGQWIERKKEEGQEQADKERQCTTIPITEPDYWQWEMRQGEERQCEKETETVQDGQFYDDTGEDGKTIYIGKSLMNRQYTLIKTKKGGEEKYPITCYPFVIGKEKERVNLTVPDRSVSRIHARIIKLEETIYIEDLHSTNGTYLNDLLLVPHEKVKLKQGDLLQFGKAEFSLR